MTAERATRSRVVFVAAVACLLLLNLTVLFAAYPETTTNDSGCCGNRTLAKDFSAFYTAAWRLVHDPGQVYTAGFVNDGEYHVLPQPETYKYLPSFLLFAIPFTALPYQQALTAFDMVQFLLLPLIAFFLYALLREKGVAVAVVIAAIALLLPSPEPQWGISAAYYWQWGEGQSKVLETFLLLFSFYLGKTGRPACSGAVFALSAFDPRFTLLGLPLFIMYNRPRLKKSMAAGVCVFLATNVFLLDPPIGSGFITTLVNSGLSTPVYYYALIPLLTVVALTLANLDEIVRSWRKLL
ncbi:MAG: DUF2029 domain-containing protein [Nitrososphaerota archaeon]|nr:DUF2029 domain-containing protein [Nitrososphaerota archaeon]